MHASLALPAARRQFAVGDLAAVSGFVGRVKKIRPDGFAVLREIGGTAGVTVPLANLSPVA